MAHIPQASKRSRRKLFTFSKTTIRRHFVDHWSFAEHFLGGLLTLDQRTDNKFANASITIDPRKLFLTIESAYQDIARYKNYHQVDPFHQKLDAVKRSAFLIKWIVRFKPITVSSKDEERLLDDINLDTLEVLNELFALYVCEVHLSNEVARDISFSVDKKFELAYDLIYRQISSDGWIAIFQMVKDCCHSQAVIKSVPFLEEI